MLRDELIGRIQTALFEHRFSYQNFSDMNSSFDLVARKENIILVIKVLSNVDSIRPEHAHDLQKMALAFHAHPIIVGEKTKVFALQPDVLYERYNLPVLSLDGFSQLLNGYYPRVRGFNGKFVVEIDNEKLRASREEHALTSEMLSREAGVSIESLNRYERGHPAQLEVAEKLEKILHAKLVRGINVFSQPPIIEKEESTPSLNNALEQLEELGIKLSVFERAPLTAAGKEQPLLISHVEKKQGVARKAWQLAKTQKIIHYPGLIVTKEKTITRTGTIPIIHEGELSTFSSVEDLLDSISPKKHEKKKK